MADEAIGGIQTRLGTLLDRVDDEFLREAIAELFTMEKLKYGSALVTCKECGHTHKYKCEVSSPDYKGIAYALKTLLDATGRTKEAPKEEAISEAQMAAIREAVKEALRVDVSALVASVDDSS